MPSVVWVTQADPAGGFEMEPVEVDAVDGDVCLTLEDGTQLVFDRVELEAALSVDVKARRAVGSYLMAELNARAA